jgi:hypothetical protein
MLSFSCNSIIIDQARFIEVRAGVRYWEDARVNGIEDAHGEIPLRKGDYWQPVVDLATGCILNWPEGVIATTCYKVCDEGDYWLLDASRKRIAKWKRLYVPSRFFDVDHGGIVSDYIVLRIGSDGMVEGWCHQSIESEQWDFI